jgi:hypothetical protein
MAAKACSDVTQEKTMGRLTLLAHMVIVCAGCILFGRSAAAIDLTGVWATDASVCDKVFAKKGNAVSFRRDSDIYGGGFIIDGRRIRGRSASCTIKSSKEDGSTIHIIAGCATDIMLSTVQFSVRVIDDNTITRIFPGIEGMELTYYRCPAR